MLSIVDDFILIKDRLGKYMCWFKKKMGWCLEKNRKDRIHYYMLYEWPPCCRWCFQIESIKITSMKKEIVTSNHITSMFLISSCRCLCPIHWSQVLSREWRCSWSSASKRCSNYIWISTILLLAKVQLILEVWGTWFSLLKNLTFLFKFHNNFFP